MADEYRITSVADFMAIPAEKRGACLVDFAEWLRFTSSLDQLQPVADLKEIGVETIRAEPVFIWVDDGKPGISAVEFVFDQVEVRIDG